MPAKKMGSKAVSKFDIFYVIVLIVIAGSIFTTFFVYSEYQQYAKQTGKTIQEILDRLNQLRERFSVIKKLIPKALLERMFEGGIISMTYLEVINFTVSGADTKAVVFNNSGDYPLTDFEVLLNEEEIEPYYKPAMVFPGKKGIVVLYLSQVIEWHLTEGVVEVKSAQGFSIKVKTAKKANGLTGYFVLTE